MTELELLDRIVPISDFNRGKASAAFSRVDDGLPIIIAKHNKPSYVITTTEDYRRAKELEEDFELYMLAVERMKDFDPNDTISEKELMEEFGITEEELAAMPEVEFE